VIENDDFDGMRWLDQIACKDCDPDDFFVAAGHTISEMVLELCRTCPVRQQCLKHAYDRGIDAGYLAGLSPSERRRLSYEDAVAFLEKDPPRKTVRRSRRSRRKVVVEQA
jgi:WhiB family transcriptional regulator, redox-sensing transcriptional regulator